MTVKTYKNQIAECVNLYDDNYARFEAIAEQIPTKKTEWQGKLVEWNKNQTPTEDAKKEIGDQLKIYNSFKKAADDIQPFREKYKQTMTDLKEACTYYHQPLFKVLTQINYKGKPLEEPPLEAGFNEIALGHTDLAKRLAKINKVFDQILDAMNNNSVTRDMEALAKYSETGYKEWWFVSKAKQFFEYAPYLNKVMILNTPAQVATNSNSQSITSSWNKKEEKKT